MLLFSTFILLISTKIKYQNFKFQHICITKYLHFCYSVDSFFDASVLSFNVPAVCDLSNDNAEGVDNAQNETE